MAHVREERRLGAVDLGQGFGAALCAFVSAGAGEAGGELTHEELSEAAQAVIERAMRVQTGDEHTGGLRFPGLRDGQQHRARWLALPGALRPVKSRRQIHDLQLALTQQGRDWPKLGVCDEELIGRMRVGAGKTRVRHLAQRLAFGIEQIHERERQVMRAQGQAFFARREHFQRALR